MKRNPWLVTGLVLLVVLGLIVAGAKLILPRILKNKIEAASKDLCAECVVYFKNVEVSLRRPGLLRFHDVRFVSGQGGRFLVEARIRDLNVDVSLLKSRRDFLVIESVEALTPEVIDAEGDAPGTEGPRKKSARKLGFQILSTRVENGLFRYVRTKNKHTAILHVHAIRGKMGAVGTTRELNESLSEAQLTGQIEKSGECELRVAARLRPGPWDVNVFFNVENQTLNDLNPFFTVNDGLEFQGTLLKGVAKIHVRGDLAKAHVEAVYKDGGFKEKPTDGRSAVEAELKTYGASLLIHKSNTERRPDDRQAEIEVARDGGEKIVHFILRSAKLGLIEVVKK